MSKAKILRNKILPFDDGKFEVQIRVFEVTRSLKFPDGIKARCALLDLKLRVAKIILDNHTPFGYHLHTKLPEDPAYRVMIDVKNYDEAIHIFMNEVRKVIKDET